MFVEGGKTENKADVFSLESLIAWLEKQPADGEYCYHDLNGHCLICQYLTSHGVDFHEYGLFMDSEARTEIAAERPWTFGAALTRARAIAPPPSQDASS